MRVMVGVAALLIAAVPVWALDSLKPIGDGWLIGHNADRFGDQGVTLVAKKAREWLFSVKCVGKTYYMAISPLDDRVVKMGEKFAVKFRVDKGEIADTRAIASDAGLITIGVTPPMLVALGLGDEAALRLKQLDNNEQIDVIIPLKGGERAMGKLFAACK